MNNVEHSLHIGLVINPTAGIGGPAALKGSDDKALVERALAEGAELRAEKRAARCLGQLAKRCPGAVKVSTYGGSMGQQVAIECGFEPLVVGHPQTEKTSAEDTQRAVADLVAESVDILVFAGGDGTARDVCQAIGEHTPALGIPTGVKMHSGVFAVSPEAAAELLELMIRGELVDIQPQEVRDIDEAALRQGIVKSRYFGELSVPQNGQFVQQVKQGGQEVEELVLDDIAAELIENLDPETLYLVGAGTTPKAFMDQLGLPNTLLGVDAVLDEQLLDSDMDAASIEALVENHVGPIQVILSVTGQQGALFGRGNQQFTAKILRRLGRDAIVVVATKTKIRSLQGRSLLMDSNDVQLDRQWQGYIRVITGYRDAILYPLGDCPDHTNLKNEVQGNA